MRVTSLTKEQLAARRQKRDLEAKGYEQITCQWGIGELWQLDRGSRIGWKLTDVVLGVDGLSVFVKAEPINPKYPVSWFNGKEHRNVLHQGKLLRRC